MSGFGRSDQPPATRETQRSIVTIGESSGDPDQRVTMYSTVWCGYCRRLKSQMEREGIAYVEVDIEDVPGAADLVMSVNGGMQTVPTLVFPDGSALTNPSLAQVKAQLAA
jgi:mycoredoxin